MHSSDDSPQRLAAPPPIEPDEDRSGPSRVVVLLLLVQSILLTATALYYTNLFEWQIDWARPFAPGGITLSTDHIDLFSLEVIDALSVASIFLPLGLLLALNALGTLFYPRTAWTLAMIVQGIILYSCLTLYLSRDLLLIYAIMAYAIVTVLYLNSYPIRTLMR